MKNILHTIRKELSFSPEIEPSLERRLFRLICLTITFITFLLIPANYLQNLPLMVNVTLALLGCGSLILYRAALRGNHCNNTLLALLLATINVIWFFNGGSDGSVPYFFFPICMYPLIIFRGKKRWTTLAAIIVNGCVLIWLSYRYPWLITAYKSPAARAVDLMIGIVISALACIMVLWTVLGTYLREHERLNLLNLKLEHEIAERMRREEKIKQAEDDLRESEERYRGLVELSPDAIYIHSRGKLIFVNSRGAELLGAERPEDLYGREALDFVHPDSREYVQQRIANAFRSGETNPPVEEKFVRLDGSPLAVEVSSVPFTYRGEDALQIFAREIGERKKIQDELLKAQKLESLGVLAGGIAHDFNNLLTGILGNISLARINLDPRLVISERLDQCQKAAIQAGKLTKQLLTFARGGEPVRNLIDIVPLLWDAASFSLRGSKVRSIVEIAENLWCSEADSGQVSQVLHNLLFNAAQAMPAGGEVKLRAVNETLPDNNLLQLPAGAYLMISVEDQGCGIPQENLTRIFDPYFTTKSHGSGLGLASVYSIVKRHGGAIGVSSTMGAGSCFTVYLPANRCDQAENESWQEGAVLCGSGKVLVMDDEEFVRDTVAAMLDTIGYRVDLCSDGREAIARFNEARGQNAPYAAVILDLTVPGGMGEKRPLKLCGRSMKKPC